MESTTQIQTDTFTLEIEETETYLNTDDEPTYVDLKLTLRDEHEEEVTIFASDEELNQMAQAILRAVRSKQDRERQRHYEDELEEARRRSPKKRFVLRGEIGRALAHLNYSESDGYEERVVDDDTLEAVVYLPDDPITIRNLRWLSEAYCFEWQSDLSLEPQAVRWKLEGF
jgi:hypothetical protein